MAKEYAKILAVRSAYSSNGHGIYGVDMETAKEGELAPTPLQASCGRRRSPE